MMIKGKFKLNQSINESDSRPILWRITWWCDRKRAEELSFQHHLILQFSAETTTVLTFWGWRVEWQKQTIWSFRAAYSKKSD